MKFKVFDTVKKEFDCVSDYYLDKKGGLYLPCLFGMNGEYKVSMQKQSHVIPIYSTGLKDKNQKEIYEGDIVECKMTYKGGFLPHMGTIVYMRRFGAFATQNEAGDTLLHNHLLSSFEIIGSKYTNPELLNEDKP